MKSHQKFIKLLKINVYYIYFQIIEKKVISLLFEINVHECELHSILMYKWDFFCSLKHTKLNFLCQISVFLFKNDATTLRYSATYQV